MAIDALNVARELFRITPAEAAFGPVGAILVTIRVDTHDETYAENMKDPIEVQPPGGDRLFLILCVCTNRHYMPFPLLDDLPLDPRCRGGSTVCGVVNEVPKMCVAAAARVVSWLVASCTESLSSFNRSPFNPQSRAVQTSAQANPSST